MDYCKFKTIFNETIFDRSKSGLIKKIANSPERYIGLFRPTRPEAKIIQNLTHSHEIRFGDAFEILIGQYLLEYGFSLLDKGLNSNDKKFRLDQIFCNQDRIFFVEQKIRDDHDSGKKEGEVKNFEEKLKMVLARYRNKNPLGFFYFIDDSFEKNKNFYSEKIHQLSSTYQIDLHLSYGADLFNCLEIGEVWDEILCHLKMWKNEVPDLTDINFDSSPQESFEEIKKLGPRIYEKLFSNSDLDSILRVLFPKNETLKLLRDYFIEQAHRNNKRGKYKKLSDLCAEAISRLSV